jgi:hypothetical protein
MAIDYATLKAEILAFLRLHPQGFLAFDKDYSQVFRHLEERKLNPTLREDSWTVHRIFHELYLDRVIVTGRGFGQKGDAADMCWPAYSLSPFGHKLLAQSEYMPYDPDGYLASLQRNVPGVNQVVLRYLEESLACFRTGCLLASAVTLGCAAEKIILELVDAFGAALANPSDCAAFANDTKMWMIGPKFDALWKWLEPRSGSLPRALKDGLERKLLQAFDVIRTTRNKAGHPTDATVEREDMHANLLLFPMCCARAYGLIEYFGNNSA